MLQSRMFSSLARLITKNLKITMNSREMQKNFSVLEPNDPVIMSISNEKAVATAAAFLLGGKVVGLPTDTIYGLAVSVQNNIGLKRLYNLKKREIFKPLSICVGDIAEVHIYGDTTHLDPNLLEALLPGPVTILLKRKSILNRALNPNSDLVGIRVPNLPFVQNVTRYCGAPLALTSANLSTEESALNIDEFKHLWPYLAGVFDGGVLGGSRAGSTIIDLSEPGFFKIIRQGSALENSLSIVKKYELKEKLEEN